MKIPIFKSLETQQQWSDFSALEIPYAYVSTPLSLVDFQTSFLQITRIHTHLRDGRKAEKYSLGSRRSTQPAWSLIANCDWSLRRVLEGLDDLEFVSNVRDNSLLNVHSDLFVRKFFNKEKHIISPQLLSKLSPLEANYKKYSIQSICRLLTQEQYQDLQWLSHPAPFTSIKALTLDILCFPENWRTRQQGQSITLHQGNNEILRFQTNIIAKSDNATTRIKEQVRDNLLLKR